jgi:hypothetical protein
MRIPQWLSKLLGRPTRPKPQPAVDDDDFLGSPEHFYLMASASRMKEGILAARRKAAEAAMAGLTNQQR